MTDSNSYAPFVYDAWRSPEVLDIVSKIAGIEVIPEMDFEIAHINVSISGEEQKQEALAALVEKSTRDADKGVSGCRWEDEQPVVDWHTDSYPFVCVLMLSDCTNMIGGETALRTGCGDIMKVRGPQIVSSLTFNMCLDTNHSDRGVLWCCKVDTSNIGHFVLSAPTSVSPWSRLSVPSRL